MHKIKSFLYFLKTIYQQRYVIRKLVARDFQKKYLGSYLGLFWAFVQPMSYILVLWFVVSIGLRGGRDLGEGIDFLPWFVSGIIPWFFIRDSIQQGSGSLIEYSFLIKKMYFRTGIIPLIKIMNVLLIHFILLLLLIAFALGYGHYPSIYWIQLPYYLLGSFILVTGIAWLNASLMVFVKDIKEIISVLMTLFFWLTPIIWPHDRLEGKMRLIVDLNPFFYITNGYRETFILNQWFYESGGLSLYFWFVAAFFFITGAVVFKKLKPHFTDVL